MNIRQSRFLGPATPECTSVLRACTELETDELRDVIVMSLRSMVGWILMASSFGGVVHADAMSGHGAAGALPFEQAEVRADPRSNHFIVSWLAPGEHQINVFASESASGAHPRLVGIGADSGKISVDDLGRAPRWYFELTTVGRRTLIVSDRSLHLDSMPNRRDIGGYRTINGHWVNEGLLYRSEKISQISRLDWPTYARLGLRQVIDLRTDQDRIQEPDRLSHETESIPLDVHKDSKLVPQISLVFQQTMDGRGNVSTTESLVEASYREMVSSPNGRLAYGAMLHVLISVPHAPLLIHCSSGKDRTGWAAALILSLLGVPRDTIIADYMLSNSLLAPQNRLFVGGKPSAIQANLMPFLEVRSRYIEAAFDEVERQYGSLTSYATKGLGFSAADIAELKNRYLAKEDY
jgi:protein-tyrosine phosphatase